MLLLDLGAHNWCVNQLIPVVVASELLSPHCTRRELCLTKNYELTSTYTIFENYDIS